MKFDFKGKVAMVTGASVGIGRAAALKLAEGGAEVVLLDVNEEKLKAVQKECEAFGVKAKAYQCDVSDEAAVYAVADDAIKTFGKVDILVNNAALWRDEGLFHEIDTKIWEKYMHINVLGTMYCTRSVINGMLERGWGRVVNVASVVGVYGQATAVHYSATKGAVIAFTKALAKETSGKGVTVNSIAPGTVSPSNVEDINYFCENLRNYTGRTGTDAENAALICFLASEEAAYVSGENILIDGCRKVL